MNAHDTPPRDEPAGPSSTATDQGPPPPSGRPPVPRLVRLPSEGPGAGVAAGLGAYFGVDPVLFRVAFVVLALAGGSGVLLYAIGWLVIPAATPEEAAAGPVRAASDRTAQWVGIGLVLVAALWLTGSFDVAPPMLWALALLAVGVLLFREDANRRAAGPPAGDRPAAVAESADPAVRDDDFEGWSAAGWDPPAAGWAATPAQAPAAAPRSVLGRATAGVALVAVGLLALVDNLFAAVSVPPARYVALALLVVGAGLLVGARWGRARGLIVVGLLLLPLLAATAFFPFGAPWRGGVGEQEFRPAELVTVRDEYRLGAGQLSLDLSAVDFGDEARTVRASVGLGELTVVVPDDVDVEVDAQANGGELNLFGQTAQGGRLDRSVTDTADTGSGGGQLTLDLEAGFGEITVQRASG